MIFFNDAKIYYNCFNFLINDYGYYITSKDITKGLLYSRFILGHDKYPEITIEIERTYLVVLINIEGKEQWSLSELYKFLHHDEIVRCKYCSSFTIEKYFEETTRKYLDDILENLDSLNNDVLDSFYKEFPRYVFVWN